MSTLRLALSMLQIGCFPSRPLVLKTMVYTLAARQFPQNLFVVFSKNTAISPSFFEAGSDTPPSVRPKPIPIQGAMDWPGSVIVPLYVYASKGA